MVKIAKIPYKGTMNGGGKSFLIRDLLGDVLRSCDRLQPDRQYSEDTHRAIVSSTLLKHDDEGVEQADCDARVMQSEPLKLELLEADNKCHPGEKL